ncbi:MAG: thioesterase domain-containing protein [Bacillota bacterium]|nr:thioesterase domain-containing protein [Bacillota bacterium]
MGKIKLFCFPYAGGSARNYIRWNKALGEDIDLIPIELRGRGDRNDEPFYDSIEEAVDDIYLIIKDKIYSTPYAFFGHSMGAYIAFELARKIQHYGNNPPVQLFASGKEAPQNNKLKLYGLSNEEFKRGMIALGTAPEIFEDEELFNIFGSRLRADCKILDKYKFKKESCKLNSDITVLYGREDSSISIDEFLSWKIHTGKSFDIRCFDGGHLFLNSSVKELTNYLKECLSQYYQSK